MKTLILSFVVFIVASSCQKKIILSENQKLVIGKWHLIQYENNIAYPDSIKYVTASIDNDWFLEFNTQDYIGTKSSDIYITQPYWFKDNMLTLFEYDVPIRYKFIRQDSFLILTSFNPPEIRETYIKVN